MKRHVYRGYVIDTDNLGRLYIQDTASPYVMGEDKILIIVGGPKPYTQARKIIDERIRTGRDIRSAFIL